MASALTHLGFVNDLNKKYFKLLNLDYVFSGALFPDYYGFYKIQLKKQYEIEKIIKNHKGIVFGKKMLSLATTNEEFSFAIGFITHSVLDKHFHNYFKKNTNIEEHLMLEFFYDCNFKNLKIPKLKYPKNIIEKTLLKYYKYKNIKKSDITYTKLKIYNLFLKELKKQIILKKYIKNKKTYVEILAKLFNTQKLNLKNTLEPNLVIKKKHFKKLNKIYKEALKECDVIFKNQLEQFQNKLQAFDN